MNPDDPIAIVGRGCVLPGCLSPDSLWQAVVEQRSLLTHKSLLEQSDTLTPNPAPSAIGGFIDGFDSVFDAQQYHLPGVNVASLDPVVQWPLHASHTAWNEAGAPDVKPDRCGLILANLSYPTRGKAEYASDIWLNGQSATPCLNAFNSGLPAQLIARSLGASGDAFALDAACASSLYALQIACRKLHHKALDVAVVSAVNAAHHLMLQRGFTALQALSASGRSQPFAASADGLVPAQGAAAVVLKRLSDVGSGERVFGLIRAVGLSNDGRRGGFLVPDAQGQLEAMKRAYHAANIDPESIDYLECHATGTPVGDSIEIQSAGEFFGARSALPVGSVKSNTGHLITVAGLASLLKLTSAFQHDTLPPTRIQGELNSSFDESCLYPLTQCRAWDKTRTRRAAISNFGFGGNNAHLVLEEHKRITAVDTKAHQNVLTVNFKKRSSKTEKTDKAHRAANNVAARKSSQSDSKHATASHNEALQEPIVICALGALAGADRGTDRIVRRLMNSPESVVEPCTSITLDPLALKTPPRDFQHMEPQQLAIMAVVDDALEQLKRATPLNKSNTQVVPVLDSGRIGVFTGMGCASDACRWLLREQLEERIDFDIDELTVEKLKDEIIKPMSSADVLGAMPNMPANRVNAAYDFRAQGYSVSAEERSDVAALRLGCDALHADEIDMAVVSAADFASESVRAYALGKRSAECTGDSSNSDTRYSDKACALVIMRESTAVQMNVPILGKVLDHFADQPAESTSASASTSTGTSANTNTSVSANASASASASPYMAIINQVYGSAPISDTLFTLVVATALSIRGQHVLDKATQPLLNNAEPHKLRFCASESGSVSAVSSDTRELQLAQPMPTPDPLRTAPHLFYASADNTQQLCRAITERVMGGTGALRIAVLASCKSELEERLLHAVQVLSQHEMTTLRQDEGCTCLFDGAYLGAGEFSGEVAFVYTGAAAAYPKMGRGLLMAFPDLASDLIHAFPSMQQVAHLLSRPTLSAYEELCAVSLVSQAHTLFLRDIMKLKPEAVIGLSLGETNSLYGAGIWKDSDGVFNDSAGLSMYEQHLGGEFRTAAQAWGEAAPVQWTNWRMYRPVAQIADTVARFSRSHITIIYSDDDCIIGGPAEECQAIVNSLGHDSGVLMQQHLTVHTPTLHPYADTWREIHNRPTNEQVRVRVYSHGTHASYTPTRENIADQLTQQALSMIDFRKIVEQAYADGVRTFVEIGPRDTLTNSVSKILGSRDHLAVAADSIEHCDAWQMADTSAQLYVSGHKIDIAALADRLSQLHHHPWQARHSRPSDITIKTGFTMPNWPEPKEIAGTSAGANAGASAAASALASMPSAPTLPVPDYLVYQSNEQRAATTTSTTAQVETPLSTPVPTPSQTDVSHTPSGTILTSVGVDVPLPQRTPIGPCFEYEQIELASRGRMSALFGEAFKIQDEYVRQVRLPAPPLLMVDRIIGIDAEPGVEACGTIWTETDVQADQWYLHSDVMRPGPLIECGQADLSLIAWMGADFRNRDERVYRLLGCEMTVHDEQLPKVGDTLCYQIEITGHAEINGIRLFFFQYDCRVDGRLVFSVRHGQAGFFTKEELAASNGVLVELENEAPPTATPPEFDYSSATKKRKFSANDLNLLRQGDAYACFGEGFEHCAAHSNPPRLPVGKLALFDEVSQFDPHGGAWGRGYLQAVAKVPVDAWFYDGHFHNDPCMPGTLMAEAAVQALECLAMAMGITCQLDGWIFEPVPGGSARFECRGQVIPDREHVLTYDVHVDQIHDGEIPEIHAALITSCDGHKVFYCPSFKVRLRRQWPEVDPNLKPSWIGPENESRGDWPALLACGNGAPSAAFGKMYRSADASTRVPRLPQPPYHMISRVLSVSTRPNEPQIGATVVTEYDVSAGEWYFEDSKNRQMPFAVLLEVALQPCGWLGSHGGFALLGGECFRNLDGNATINHNVNAVDQRIRVESTMTRFSTMGSMTIVNFDVIVDSSLGHRILTLDTSFGFFPMQALVRQVGLDTTDEQRALRELPAAILTADEPKAFMPAGKMLMIDAVDYFDASGGEAGLGLIRGYQTVDPYAWYFKAHFYQDPVQPGSLGLDALLQLTLRAVVLKGLSDAMQQPCAEYITPEHAISWSYRGQVTPSAKKVTLVVQLDSVEQNAQSDIVVSASGSLWRDELRIYECNNMSIRVFDAA